MAAASETTAMMNTTIERPDEELCSLINARKKEKESTNRMVSKQTQAPISNEDKRDFAAMAIQALIDPLVLFITEKILNELIKKEKKRRGESPYFFRFFKLDGRPETEFLFNMNSRLFDKEKRNISFVELCFGPQKKEGNYNDRDIDKAFFNELGLGFEYSPLYQLGRQIYDYFLKYFECKVFLNIETFNPRGDYKEGLSVINVTWNESLHTTTNFVGVNWMRLMNIQSKYTYENSEHDAAITVVRTAKLEDKFSHWSCSEDLLFDTQRKIFTKKIEELKVELRDIQKKPKTHHKFKK